MTAQSAATSPTMPLCLRRPTLRVLCVRARLARSILAQVAKRVPVDVVMPDGTLLGGGTRRRRPSRCSRSCARRPSSSGSRTTPRSGSARPTWPATGRPPRAPTSPSCSCRSPSG